jgi:hypothetical protein
VIQRSLGVRKGREFERKLGGLAILVSQKGRKNFDLRKFGIVFVCMI